MQGLKVETIQTPAAVIFTLLLPMDLSLTLIADYWNDDGHAGENPLYNYTKIDWYKIYWLILKEKNHTYFIPEKNKSTFFSVELLVEFSGGLCFQLLMIPLIMSVLYVWAQFNKDMIVSFWFGTRFKVRHVHWPAGLTTEENVFT